MSILEKDKVDLIGLEEETNVIKMTITDHLDWSDEEAHLRILQEKLNGYIEFVESGQITIDYPDSKNVERKVIEIISEYDYPEVGIEFLEKAKPVLNSIGLEIVQTTFKE